MKCVDCKTEFVEEVKQRHITTTLVNPGNVSAKGQVLECPKCNQHYADENETLRLMDVLEKNRLKQEINAGNKKRLQQ